MTSNSKPAGEPSSPRGSEPNPLEAAFTQPSRAALVFGSGLGELANRLDRLERIPYDEIPGLRASTVPGHAGCLTSGTWSDKRVLVFEGRLHFYEGHSWQTVLMPIELIRRLGVPILLVTNAAGGIHPDLEPGRLMIISDHLDWTEPWTWRRPKRPSPYSSMLVQNLQQAGRHLGLDLPTGTYAQVTGPCYETPAEIRALRSVGADAVGMSTAREIQAALDAGLECAGLSCITNRAAGLASGPLLHEDVLAVAARQAQQVGDLLDRFLRTLPAETA